MIEKNSTTISGDNNTNLVALNSEKINDYIFNLYDDVAFNLHASITQNPNDRDIALRACRAKPILFKHLNETFRDDDEICEIAFKKYGHALKYASDKIKDNLKLVKLAVKQKSSAIKYASERIRKDKKLTLFAVSKCGWALEDVWEDFKDDKEVVLAAVKHHGYAIQYASKRLQEDKDVIETALAQNPTALNALKTPEELDEEFNTHSSRGGFHFFKDNENE